MKQLKWWIASALTLVLLSVAVGIGVGVMDNRVICPGVQVSGVDVGGLTPEQTQDRLQAALASRLDDSVTLVHGTQRWSVTPRKVGITFDVKGTVERAHRVGKEGSWLNQLRTRLHVMRRGQGVVPSLTMSAQTPERFESLRRHVDKPPVNAEAEWQGNTGHVVPERMGVRLDAEETANRVRERAINCATTNAATNTVEIAVKVAPPKITARDLADINALLASYTTRFNSGLRNRTHNMRLAARLVDKTFVPADGTFSYNTAIGPRLATFGYKPAPTFRNNEVVQEVGGGVCQVATTVYNAALLAGQDIKARSHHSRPVDYAPHGRDATVYFGQQDLKFRNSFPHAVYLRIKLEGNQLTAYVLGSAEDKQPVEIVQTKERRIPASIVKIADPQLPPGKEVVVKRGRSGYQTTVVRLITTPRGKKREVVSNAYYAPQNTIVRFGVVPPQENVSEPKSEKPVETSLR